MRIQSELKILVVGKKRISFFFGGGGGKINLVAFGVCFQKRLLTVIREKLEYSFFFSPKFGESFFWKDASNIAAGKTGQLQKTPQFYNNFVI